MQHHSYELSVRWTGNLGQGTQGYGSYSRAHEIAADGRPTILGTSDPGFRGDASRWNPEQLFLAAVSQCHMLWYLHLAAVAGIVVTGYADRASAVLVEEESGAGQFASMTLRPSVTISDPADAARAEALHDRAQSMCFLARSVRFPIHHQPSTVVPAATVDQQPA